MYPYCISMEKRRIVPKYPDVNEEGTMYLYGEGVSLTDRRINFVFRNNDLEKNRLKTTIYLPFLKIFKPITLWSILSCVTA